MKRARVIVLAIAITAAIGAAWIARAIVLTKPEIKEVEKTVGSTDVLVAASRLSYLKYVAKGPDCPDWSENLARDPQNLPWPNMGCAMQKNLAAMVADPEDLLVPRPETPRTSERRDTVWGKYVAGEHANVSDISQIGTGQ